MRVIYPKFDGSLHWHHKGVVLGEDEYGVWVGAPPGTIGARGHEPPFVWELPFVVLFPASAWWTATFNPPGHKNALYCDITTVPEWVDGDVTMIDLDLDVIRRASGTVLLDDADEFADHKVRYGYPADVVQAAEAAAGHLLRAVEDGNGPFGGAHEKWLAEASGLPA